MKENIKNFGIKSKYIVQKVLEHLDEKRLLQITKETNYLQNLMGKTINDYKNNYKKFSSIEIEIKPSETYGKFINLDNKDEGEEEREKNYRIYFNDSKVEIKNKYYLNESDKVTKIRILVGYKEKSFAHLFMKCDGIESINFKKFYRNNIESMTDMFYECTSMKEINLSNFITDNVIDMRYMFYDCYSLKELNLSHFNTNNVIDMVNMFLGCSDELLMKIKSQYKNIKEEAFK